MNIFFNDDNFLLMPAKNNIGQHRYDYYADDDVDVDDHNFLIFVLVSLACFSHLFK